jgi:hypothetical protein
MAFAVTAQSVANPAIAKKTGKACGACHTTPPALYAAGQKYKAGMKKQRGHPRKTSRPAPLFTHRRRGARPNETPGLAKGGEFARCWTSSRTA